MGNESEGLSRVVKESCDFLVKLPQMGEVASLNVAQASTACRAFSTPAVTTSSTVWPLPSSLKRLAPKVLVFKKSAPASK